MYHLGDTICAIASAPGGAARGIVRISGSRALECLRPIFDSAEGATLDGLRSASVIEGSLRLDGFASRLPCELYVWPSRRSYTREPMVEIHTIGSPPLVEAVLRCACAAGARPAAAGEFTLRAFLAGRIDLTQAEAVLGVVEAADSHELQVALQQLAGGLSAPLGELRGRLLDLLAHLEAGLDFAEDDIEFIARDELKAELSDAATMIRRLTEQMKSRSVAGERVRVVISGLPNVGKSSLFNALAGRNAAITSHESGTTRDYLTATVKVDGFAYELVDTAGTYEEHEVGELEDLDRAAQAMSHEVCDLADIQILCLDSTRPLRDGERAELARNLSQPRMVVLTKTDMPRRTDFRGSALATSSRTGAGLDRLREQIHRAVAGARPSDASVVSGTSLRCRESLRVAAECLERCEALAAADGGHELIAAEIRVALDEIGQVVGAVYTDDILDRVFSRFCIGK